MPRLSRVDIALTLLLTVSFDVFTWWSVEVSVVFALLLQTLSVVTCYYLSVTPAIIEPISALWSTVLKHEIKMGIVFVFVLSCAVSSYVRCLGAGVLTFRCLVVLDFLDKIEEYCFFLLSVGRDSKLETEDSSVIDSHISSAALSEGPSSQQPNISVSIHSCTKVNQSNAKPTLMQANTASPMSQMRSSSLLSSPQSLSTSTMRSQNYTRPQQVTQLSVIQSPPFKNQPSQEQAQEERRVSSRKHARDNDDDNSNTGNNNHQLFDSQKLSLVPAPKARRVVIHPFQTTVLDEESLIDIVVASNHKKSSNSHTVHHRPVLKRKVYSHQEEDIEVIQDWMEDNSRTKRRKILELEQLSRSSTVSADKPAAGQPSTSLSLPATSSAAPAAPFGSSFAFDSSSTTAAASAPKHVSFTVSTNDGFAASSAPAEVSATVPEAPFTFNVPSSTAMATPTDDKKGFSSASVAPLTAFLFPSSSSAATSATSTVAFGDASKSFDVAAPASTVAGSEGKISSAPVFGFSLPQAVPVSSTTTSSTPAFNFSMPTSTTATTTTVTSTAPVLSIPPISSKAKDGSNGGMFSLPSPSRRPPTAPSPSSQSNKAAVPFGIAFSGKGNENENSQSQSNTASNSAFTFGSSTGISSSAPTAPTTFGFPSSNQSTVSTKIGTEAVTSTGFGGAPASSGGPFSATTLPASAAPSFPGFGSSLATSSASQQQSAVGIFGSSAATTTFSPASTVTASFGSSAASTVTSTAASSTSTVTSQQNPFGTTSSFPGGAPSAPAPAVSFGASTFGQPASTNPFGNSASADNPPTTNTAPAFGGNSNTFNPFASSGTTLQAPKSGFGSSSSIPATASVASNPFAASMAPSALTAAAPAFGGSSSVGFGNLQSTGQSSNPFGNAQPFGSAAPASTSGLPLAPTLSSHPSFGGGGPFTSSDAAQMQFSGGLSANMPQQQSGGFGGGGSGFGGDFSAGGASSNMLFQPKAPQKSKLLTKKISSHKK